MTPLRTLAPAGVALAMLLIPSLGPGCHGGDPGTIEGAVTVESQSNSSWVLWSFGDEDVLRDGDGAPLVVDDPSTQEGWDLAISQWVIATNSGTSAGGDTVSRGALLAVEGQTDAWADLAGYTARCSDFLAAGETDNRASFGCSGRTPTVDDGYIEDLHLDDGWADVVISNGVINLAPDKQAVFAEVFRVLRPGGTFQFADIANGRPVPEAARRHIDLWTG